MLTTKHAPAHELQLEAFEARLLDHEIKTMDTVDGKDPRLNSDYVPESIKKEFDLRQDMTTYEIDFDLVRSTDAQFKKR